MFDGITAIITVVSGGPSGPLNTLLSVLQTGVNTAGTLNCRADVYSPVECAAAATRLRYRGACTEQPAAASFAAGVITGINSSGW